MLVLAKNVWKMPPIFSKTSTTCALTIGNDNTATNKNTSGLFLICTPINMSFGIFKKFVMINRRAVVMRLKPALNLYKHNIYKVLNVFLEKRGMIYMWEGSRSWTSLFIGAILILLGGIPLFSAYIGFNLPEFFLGAIGQIAIYIIAGAGFYLLIDMFLEWGEDWAWVSMIAGCVFLALGVIVILNTYNVVAFGAFLKDYLTSTVYNVIFIIEGFVLAIGSFYMT